MTDLCRAAEATPAVGAARPNFVFILVDDMRYDVMSCAGHPFVKTPHMDRIAARGVRFTNAFVTISLCSPSRGTFLTGTHAHVHGVRTNEGQDLGPATRTFPQLLQAAGYRTGYVGKWHMGPTANPRPGFDYWLSFRGQGQYIDPPLNENGRDFVKQGYMTDILADYAVEFLKGAGDKPFCLYLAHKAVHGPFTPAKRHENLYADAEVPPPASFNDDMADKPRWMRAAEVRGQQRGRIERDTPVPDKLPPRKWDGPAKNNLDQLRALAAVDDSIGRVLDTLDELKLTDRTLIIFTSDNGYFHAEHRRGDKRLAYEESMRIPMLASGPGVAGGGKTCDAMVLNLDIAPTFLDLAGVAVPDGVQGRSLKPLLGGQSPPGRESFLYEYFQEEWLSGVPDILAVRTRDWKYVRYPSIEDIDELYDLTKDPHEMHNLAQDPAAADKLAGMKAELDRLVKDTGYTPSPRTQPADEERPRQRRPRNRPNRQR